MLQTKAMLMKTLALMLLLASAGALGASGGVSVENAVIRAVASGAPVSAGYLTLQNHSATGDRLVRVSGAIASRIELHEMAQTASGTMQMRELTDGVALPTGETVVFAPGGLHLMIFDPEVDLIDGSEVKLTLEFEHSAPIDVLFEVMSQTRLRAMDFQETSGASHEH